MERCCGQAAMVHADHVNSWWGVELRIPLLKHTKYYYFLCKVHVSTDANTGEVVILYVTFYVIAGPKAWLCTRVAHKGECAVCFNFIVIVVSMWIQC